MPCTNLSGYWTTLSEGGKKIWQAKQEGQEPVCRVASNNVRDIFTIVQSSAVTV